jgi:hypothetical protein
MVCVMGDSDGPPCDTVGIGGLCEADSECTGLGTLNNCGNSEWYMRVP